MNLEACTSAQNCSVSLLQQKQQSYSTLETKTFISVISFCEPESASFFMYKVSFVGLSISLPRNTHTQIYKHLQVYASDEVESGSQKLVP